MFVVSLKKTDLFCFFTLSNFVSHFSSPFLIKREFDIKKSKLLKKRKQISKKSTLNEYYTPFEKFDSKKL